MFFLNFLWATVAHPSVLIALVVVLLAAGLYGYVRGVPALLKIVLDLRTWLAVALVVMALAITDLKKSNVKLEAKAAVAEEVQTGKDDAAQTVAQREKARDKRDGETARIRTAIQKNSSNPLDAALDEIAAIQGAQHAKPPTQDHPRDAGVRAQPQPDGVLDHAPDGVVRP